MLYITRVKDSEDTINLRYFGTQATHTVSVSLRTPDLLANRWVGCFPRPASCMGDLPRVTRPKDQLDIPHNLPMHVPVHFSLLSA
jgi:hypothetical protein